MDKTFTYVCTGCDWNCNFNPDTAILHMPNSCPYNPKDLKAKWRVSQRSDPRDIV